MSEIDAFLGFAEPVSSGMHLLGAGVFLMLGVSLVHRQARGVAHTMTMAVYAFAAVFLLSMSGVYHLLPQEGAARAVLQRLDHGAIFILIAGTITAIHALLFEGLWRWGMIALAWTICIVGVTLKVIFFRETPELLGLALYLGFGWLGLVTVVALWRRYGFRFVQPLVYGGLAYSIGAVLEFLRSPVLIPGVIGPHELFHLAVLVGIGLHWSFVLRALECRQTETSGLPRASLATVTRAPLES